MSQFDSADGPVETVLEDDRFATVRDFPWVRTLAGGAAAWFLGYLAMAALFYVGPGTINSPTHVGKLKQIGGVFYNAHFVDVVATIGPQTTRANVVIEQTGTTIPTVVYLAIPVLALLGTAVLISFVLGSEQTVTTLGQFGLALAMGYLAVGVAGTFLAELRAVALASGGMVVLTPDLVQTLAMFIAYPFVLGVVGAAIGAVLSDSLRLEQ